MLGSKWRKPAVVVASAMAAAALTVRTAVADDAPPASQPAAGAILASSTNNPSSPDLRAVQQTLAQVVEQASAGGHCRQLVGLLSKGNRDAIGDVDPVSWADVDREVDRFRKTWQSQFGVGFNLEDKEAFVFAEPNVRMLRGTDRDAVLAEARRVAGSSEVKADIDAAPNGAKANAGKAVVMMAAEGSARPLTLFVISEGKDKDGQPAWRIEVPSGVSARSLHDSLLHHLKVVTDSRASWPSNIDQAYSFVSHHLLAAVAERPGPVSPREPGSTAMPAGGLSVPIETPAVPQR